jgi:predicted esterase
MPQVHPRMEEFRAARNGSAKRLIVVLHGYRSRRSGLFDVLLDAIHEDLPDADILAPELATARLLSTVPAAKIAGDVIDKIEERWRGRGGYDEIIVAGHSTGGALARKVIVGAWGRGLRVPFEPEGGFDRFTSPHDWAPKITRLVLIAGISSGWRTSGRERWKEWLALNFFGMLGHLKIFGAKPTIFEFRRGAAFIANTRLQMVDHLREQAEGRRPRTMTTIQMLGSSDNMVAPNESLDFNSANALDDQLFILEVPYSTHSSILEVGTGGANPEASAARRVHLRTALYGEVRGTSKIGAAPAEPLLSLARDWHELDDHMPREADMSIRNVVFVIHGIRDDGHWTKKIAARVKDAAPDPRGWRSVTPSYGYFAMLPFVLPWIRRQKVEWLMHEYCEAAAQYPNANFHFVGHSNGTFLGAAAMRDYRGCFFKHIAFAGSVVHPSYDWSARARDSGVEKVLNYVATSDWVVALAPNAVRHLRRFFDLGGAGHLGFESKPPLVNNVAYVKGGHGAAIVEDRWDEIARFIVDGTVPMPASPAFQPVQSSVIRNLAKVSPVLAALVVIAGLGILVDMTLAAVEYRWPSWLAGIGSQVAGVPILGSAGQAVASISNWWFSLPPAINVAGLIAYAGLLRFVTTRY